MEPSRMTKRPRQGKRQLDCTRGYLRVKNPLRARLRHLHFQLVKSPAFATVAILPLAYPSVTVDRGVRMLTKNEHEGSKPDTEFEPSPSSPEENSPNHPGMGTFQSESSVPNTCA